MLSGRPLFIAIRLDGQISPIQDVLFILLVLEDDLFEIFIKDCFVGLRSTLSKCDRYCIALSDRSVSAVAGLSDTVVDSLIHGHRLRSILLIGDGLHRILVTEFDRDLRCMDVILVVIIRTVCTEDRLHGPWALASPRQMGGDVEITKPMDTESICVFPFCPVCPLFLADKRKGWFGVFIIAVIQLQLISRLFGFQLIPEPIFVFLTDAFIDNIIFCRNIFDPDDRSSYLHAECCFSSLVRDSQIRFISC